MSSVRAIKEFNPRRRYTAVEFATLPHDSDHRYELDHGTVVVSPPPAPKHMLALGRLFSQIDAQLPAQWQVFPEVGVILDGYTVRVPDLVITHAGIDRDSPLVKAAQVVLAVEVVSPGSKRIDTTVKPFEYADAGIPAFWLVDPNPPVTVSAYSLVGSDYEESQRGERIFEVTDPCPLRINLDALSR